MRHVSVISGHSISIGFRGLTGCQRHPRDWVSHNPSLLDGLSIKLVISKGKFSLIIFLQKHIFLAIMHQNIHC